MTDTDRHTETDRTQTDRSTTTTDRPSTAGTDDGDHTEYRRTLGEVSHTNPFTNRTFGTTQTYGRGRTIAADGGQANVAPDDEDDETLEDVDHTPGDDDVDGAQGTFDRGREEPDGPDDE